MDLTVLARSMMISVALCRRTYDHFVFPGPSAANYHHMVSSIGSTGFHLLGFLVSLILAGFFFPCSCIAHLFCDVQWTSINKTLEAMLYTPQGATERTNSLKMLSLMRRTTTGALFFPRALLCLSEQWWYGDSLS